MTEYDALLRGVLESPDDDACRLILADWLEQDRRGPGDEEYAQFIRVQCELATNRYAIAEEKHLAGVWRIGEGKHVHVLRSRERELLSRHWPRWGSSLLPEGVAGWLGADNPSVVGPTGRMSARLTRGFVAEVTLTTLAFCGGPCERCRGRGRISPAEFRDGWQWNAGQACPACKGKRRVPGCAAALFACQPVQKVTLSDAIIHPSGGTDTYYVGGLGRFPDKYWTALQNLPTRAASLDALSAACVAWGREQAGLTPRPVNPA